MNLKTFSIFAKDPSKTEGLKKELEDAGFTYSENPDFIISFGGDGTYLISEYKLPGIPKLLVRDSMICFKCHDEPISDVIQKLKLGEFQIYDSIKLNTNFNGENFTSTNDVIMRNKDLREGVRFKVTINGEESDTFIGDGVVVSTPFGSTGYYHAITRKDFDSGIGVAFNNLTKEIENKVLDENSDIKIEIVRGKAELAFDNQDTVFDLKQGDSFLVKKSDKIGKLIIHNH